jgi:ribonuclease R
LISRDKIIAFLRDAASRPLKIRELAKQLKVGEDDYRAFRRMIKELERDGAIIRLRNSRYAPVQSQNMITGRLAVTSSGFGFVSAEGLDLEVFIPATSLGSAHHTDRVLVKVTSRGGRSAQPEGEVTKVVERGQNELIGTFHRRGRFCYVEPDDARFGSVITVPPGQTADAEHGEAVAVTIEEWETTRSSTPEGRVSARLGDRDDPRVDAKAVIFSHHLPLDFPPHVLSASEDIPQAIPAETIQERQDQRDLTCFTIDPRTARDFDDAVSIEIDGAGVRRVGIHIADVSYYVTEGGALDHEAMARGTSVYLVDSVVPMLPERLSNDICSLKPGEDRLAFSVFVSFDTQNRILSTEIVSTVINSKARLTYEQAQEAIEGKDQLGSLGDAVRDLEQLRQALTKSRLEDGAIDFDLPEPEFELDDSGMPVLISARERLSSHRLVEEFMLLANRIVAERITEEGIPSLFRVHGRPDPDSLEMFKSMAATFGVRIPDGSFNSGKAITNFLNSVADKRIATVLNERLLRSMKKAEYTPKNIGHFGLAMPDYTHFTSPIRRYPDLLTHRILREKLTGKLDKDRRDVLTQRLPDLGELSTRREIVAKQAEWDSIKIKQARYLGQHLGETFSGTIVSVRGMGFFVRLDDILADGLIHVRSLHDDYYVYDEMAATLTGERSGRTFRLGDRVEVEVASADWKQKRIDFILADEPPHQVETHGRGRREIPARKGRRRHR